MWSFFCRGYNGFVFFSIKHSWAFLGLDKACNNHANLCKKYTDVIVYHHSIQLWRKCEAIVKKITYCPDRAVASLTEHCEESNTIQRLTIYLNMIY